MSCRDNYRWDDCYRGGNRDRRNPLDRFSCGCRDIRGYREERGVRDRRYDRCNCRDCRSREFVCYCRER